MIVKYVETSHNGIQSLSLSRYAIGYILRGEKYIYYGDKRHRLSRGDLFYLGMGHHYTEDIPEEGHPFEQIMFYYTPSELQRILLHLTSPTDSTFPTTTRARTAGASTTW